MNLRIICVVLVVSAGIFAQQQEFTSLQYSTVNSEYALSDKSTYRLYTPARAATVQTLGIGYTTDGDFGNLINDKQNAAVDPIKLQVQTCQLSGAYIVLLEPYLISADVNKIGANVLFNQVDNTQAFVKIDALDDYKSISQQAQTSAGVDYQGFHLFNGSLVLPGRYSLSGSTQKTYFNQNSSTNLYGYLLLNCWNQYLQSVKYTIYGSPFFVQAPNGDIYPAVIKIYGVEKLMYAMYGVWTDEQKAQNFGFHAADRIYFSAQALLPLSSDTIASQFNIATAQRYGQKVFTYAQVLANKKTIFPQLAWATESIHSDMAGKTYDATGTAFYDGIQVPDAPDNVNNMNGMGLQDCPDMDWYWGLFIECAGSKVNIQETTYQPSQFTNYKDYDDVNMMKQQYDPTVYGTDNSVAPSKANTDNVPVQPFLFNKDCVLLNARIPNIYDPFSAKATFSLDEKYWDWNITNLGYHAKGVDVSNTMKNCLSELQNVYNYFITPGVHQSDWSYKNGQKTWTYGGDVEIALDNPAYADSAWYVADPFANYAPYEDFKTFAVYENYMGINQGPFKAISCQCAKYNGDMTVPQYKRYSSQWYQFSDFTWEKKDWFVQWQYYLVFKDQWGRKVSVGTLTFTSTLWTGENTSLFVPGASMNGNTYNVHVNVGGDSLMNDQVTFYDKNSQEYRTDQADVNDRSPSDFDKGDAMREIAEKILVAEAFDYAMKTLHYLYTHQNNQVGAAAGVLYEASKRIENRISQSVAYKLAKQTYDGYVLWKKSMDVLRDLRNTYVKIGDAWDGLLYAANAIADYYSHLDLSKIRLTNITDLFPKNAFIELDYRTYSLQKSFSDFTAAVHAMALESDSLTHGNYGPLNPIIRKTYASLNSSVLQSGQNTSTLIDNVSGEVQGLKNKTTGTSSDQQYLSNITKSAYNIITNQRIKVMNNGMQNLALALYMTESEAKQWVSYSRYMKNVVKTAPGLYEKAMTSQTSASWANLAADLYQDGMFDNPTSQYLGQLSGASSTK